MNGFKNQRIVAFNFIRKRLSKEGKEKTTYFKVRELWPLFS
jgi:hypothetical protein